MIGVEVPGGLDDRGGGLVAAGDPGVRVEAGGEFALEVVQQPGQQVDADCNGCADTVGCEVARRQFIRLPSRGHQHGDDGQGVAGFVEVLGVERVLPHLVAGGGGCVLLPYLELEDDDAAGQQQHGVGAQAHAGDVEFEEKVAGAGGEEWLQEVDFGRPGVALLGVGGSVAVLEEVAEDLGGGMGEEGGEGSGVPGAREAVGDGGFH